MKFFVLLSLCGLLVSALLYKIILATAERREIRLAQLVTFFFVVIWIAIDIVLWPALMRLTMTTAVLNGITHIILLLVIATGAGLSPNDFFLNPGRSSPSTRT